MVQMAYPKTGVMAAHGTGSGRKDGTGMARAAFIMRISTLFEPPNAAKRLSHPLGSQ